MACEIVINLLKLFCINKVKHEEWWRQRKFYYQRRRDIISDWLRDRAELLNRVKNVFYEASMTRQLEDSKSENRQKQKELCDALYAKVDCVPCFCSYKLFFTKKVYLNTNAVIHLP